MGMLISRHKNRHQDEAKPKRKRSPRSRKAKTEPEAPAHESLTGDDYAALSDEQVLDAYVTTFPEGEATERDAQVAELRAVNVARDTFDADPASE